MARKEYNCTTKDAMTIFPRMEGRLYSSALEALHFSHPYKNFTVSFTLMEKDAENPIDTRLIGDINIYDHGIEVATINYYLPSGDSRSKPQLQVSFNYAVHQKEPIRVKRTSNINKITEVIQMIRPATSADIINAAPGVQDMVAIASGYGKACKEASKFMEQFYYGDKQGHLNTFMDLVNNRETAAVTEFKSKVTALHEKVSSTHEEFKAYCKQAVFVGKNAVGGSYKVCRAILDRDDARVRTFEEMSQCYADKSQLPEDIAGLIAVLEISMSSSENTKHEVEGIGRAYHWDYGDLYALIGKNFNDARKESKDQGI